MQMKTTSIFFFSLLLSSVSLFAQNYSPKSEINEYLHNLSTENLKGNVKSTRSICYNKTREADGLVIDQYNNDGNLVRSSYQMYPLAENGGCLAKLELFDYDEAGRLTGVFKSERSCGADFGGGGTHFTIKYDSQGRPIAITHYDTEEYGTAARDLNVLKTEDVFQNLDNKKIESQRTFLYDKKGRLFEEQSSYDWGFDSRTQFVYDEKGILISSTSNCHSQNSNSQYTINTYYLYPNGSSIKIVTRNDAIELIYVYNTVFSQTSNHRETFSTKEKVYDFREYNKHHDNVMVNPDNPSDALLLAQTVIDTPWSVEVSETIRVFNKGQCVQYKYNNDEKYYEYNSHGDRTKKEGFFKEYYENYQYDNHGNWIK